LIDSVAKNHSQLKTLLYSFIIFSIGKKYEKYK
jgi:hypothetical protein